MSFSEKMILPRREPAIVIIPGYGVPANEKQERELDLYVRQIRETLGAVTCPILFSGGATALEPPYERTEAEAFRAAWGSTKNEVILEEQAISTLENILYSRAKMQESGILSGRVWVFVENIRQERMRLITDMLLPDFEVDSIPLDLGHPNDASAKEGERIAIEWIKWALAKPENMNWYHDVFAEKIQAARAVQESGKSFNAVAWWQSKWDEIKERLSRDGYRI